MPSLISVPLTASGPVMALSRPILMGSRCAWATRAAPGTTIATTSPISTRESRATLFCAIIVPLSVAWPGFAAGIRRRDYRTSQKHGWPMSGFIGQINHRTVETNGIRMHVAEQGTGPLVILCHGFPESWYSWRHQLGALAAAGFHAVAPDMRGYGRTDGPAEIEAYTLLHLVGDMVGV